VVGGVEEGAHDGSPGRGHPPAARPEQAQDALEAAAGHRAVSYRAQTGGSEADADRSGYTWRVTEPGTATTLAAIDIGTNSFHLVVARTTSAIAFEIIAREKEVVRLGSGSGDMKTLAPEAIDRGIEALSRFRQIAEIADAPVRAIATSAVREADNRDDFLRRARDEAGIDVEVVSGVEEARLIHLGVLQDVPVVDRRLLLIDIGGGSTEFVVGEGTEMLEARSLKLGAIRLTDGFFADEPITSGQVKRCRTHIRAYLGPVIREVKRYGFDIAIGVRGRSSTWPRWLASAAARRDAWRATRPSPARSWARWSTHSWPPPPPSSA